MFIRSSYNLKNKVSKKPIEIINQFMHRVNHYLCLGVKWDKKLSCEENVNHTCLKVSADIGAIIRIYAFVPLSTLKML